MVQHFIDDLGVQDFVDENGVVLFVDQNVIYLGIGEPTTNEVLLPQACM